MKPAKSERSEKQSNPAEYAPYLGLPLGISATGWKVKVKLRKFRHFWR